MGLLQKHSELKNSQLFCSSVILYYNEANIVSLYYTEVNFVNLFYTEVNVVSLYCT